MKKTISLLIIFTLVLTLIYNMGCSGGKSDTPGLQSKGGNPNPSIVPTTQGQTNVSQAGSSSAPSGGAGTLRDENWLIGTWGGSIPKTSTAYFAGKKINILVSSVMLVSNEKVQGNPTGKFAYSGSLIWDIGGQEKTLGFVKEDWKNGDGVLMWGYSSPGASQFLENISMRLYDLNLSFELDWGPQMSKPGGTFKSLGFYGSIQNLDNDKKDEFDPSNLIIFTQTSSTAPPSISAKPTATPKNTTASRPSPTPSKPPSQTASVSTSTTQATANLWSDIPVYTSAVQVQDMGFQQPGGSDTSLKTVEWRFFETPDAVAKVADYYKTQMVAKGWTKTMWADIGPMSYGTYQKNNETRACFVYVIENEGKTSVNIMSGSK